MSLALPCQQRPNVLRFNLLNATRSLENVAFHVDSKHKDAVKCRSKAFTMYITQ